MVKRHSSIVPDRVGEVQEFVVARWAVARRRFQKLEKQLVARGRAQQQELESLLGKVGSPKALEKRANAAAHDIRRALERLQKQVIAALGLASHHEIAQISRDVAKLTRRVEQLVERKSMTPQA